LQIADDARRWTETLGRNKRKFYVKWTEYLSPIILFEKGKIASQIVYSNLAQIVEQQQYFFDTLWSKAIPAKDRIYELEHGVEESPFIETIRDPVEVQMVASAISNLPQKKY
jgi:hypothetical protein